MSAAYYHSPELPWSPALAEERRFRLIGGVTLVAFVVFCVLMATVKLPPLDRGESEAIPPRLARLVIPAEKPQPPPPPEPVKPESEKKPETAKPETRPQAAPPAARVQAAREKAQRSGLLAMQNELTSLQKNTLSDLLAAKPLTQHGTEDTRRSIITSNATRGSGGINTSQLGRDAGDTRLAMRDTTQVESELLKQEDKPAKKDGRKPGRSTEQIKLVLDQNKGAIYTLYLRALRSNPALQGKVVLEITIAPSGDVTNCKVISSELQDDDLIRKLVARVKLFQFGAKSVDPAVFTWPIDFLPTS